MEPLSRRNRVLAAVGVLGLLTGLMAAELRHDLVPRRWAAVVPGSLYRSGQLSRYLVAHQLRRHDIETIIDLQFHDPRDPHQTAEERAAARQGIQLLRFPLRGDGTGQPTNFQRAFLTLLEELEHNRTVLVHCHAGTDRTGGLLYCYRVLIDRVDPATAVTEMQNFGWSARADNPLIPFIDSQLETLAHQLVARGTVPHLPQPLPLLSQAVQSVGTH